MDEHILVGLSAVVALGISAQWFAWRTKLPAILVLLIFGIVAGPVSIYVATWGSKLSLQEKTFLAWMAPRGIVAAAISAIFALRLEQEGFVDALKLVPYTFVVIIATVTV